MRRAGSQAVPAPAQSELVRVLFTCVAETPASAALIGFRMRPLLHRRCSCDAPILVDGDEDLGLDIAGELFRKEILAGAQAPADDLSHIFTFLSLNASFQLHSVHNIVKKGDEYTRWC